MSRGETVGGRCCEICGKPIWYDCRCVCGGRHLICNECITRHALGDTFPRPDRWLDLCPDVVRVALAVTGEDPRRGRP